MVMIIMMIIMMIIRYIEFHIRVHCGGMILVEYVIHVIHVGVHGAWILCELLLLDRAE